MKNSSNRYRLTQDEEAMLIKYRADRMLESIDTDKMTAVSDTKSDGEYIVAGCLHMPFHNRRFFDSLLGVANELSSQRRLKGLILNGDILDMHSISRHNKGKITIPGLTLTKEYEEANRYLDMLDQAVGDVSKDYFYGNHEMWYHQHMSEVDNQKLGNGVVKSPAEACFLNRGYVIQEDYKNAYVTIGDHLEVIHGDYVNIHAAKKHLDVMKRSVMFAHTHRIGSHHEWDKSSHNIGWGGDVNSPVFSYMTRVQKENWRNGFAVVNIENGFYSVNQLVFINDGIIFEGNRY